MDHCLESTGSSEPSTWLAKPLSLRAFREAEQIVRLKPVVFGLQVFDPVVRCDDYAGSMSASRYKEAVLPALDASDCVVFRCFPLTTIGVYSANM